MEKIYHIGPCPICQEYGMLEIYKVMNDDRLIVICDECSAEWNSPLDVKTGVKGLRQSRINERVEVASINDIKKRGWDIYVINL